MIEQKVTIYTCNYCSECKKLVEKMNSWGLDYTEKNISDNLGYLKEMQKHGIYGTPATFVNDDPVLGFRESELKNKLGLADLSNHYER
ncbi:NrdH-redoxin [Virgibacillus phasianinus]|uniref:NrdH-redoxin n=1 Tax=Virgibacillus phasianinus TaxID=2017483 RepID=A0A220TZ37_9BACI|nr:glutaredoxin family protein [Virgibacillus phasianinus]ASK61264.1 NrdH-redoxin [Virgibacillus phasianinus]